MTVPSEYKQANERFMDFLTDVRVACEFETTNQAYTTAQAVFQVFRRRLSLHDAIRFATALPGSMRALFVAGWDPDEPQRPFAPREELMDEVLALRRDHNYSPDGSITRVAWAVARNVEGSRFAEVLRKLPRDAADFWRVDDADGIGERAEAWRRLRAPEGTVPAAHRLTRW
jgi:uncharacterized protein (DUF2267 family)